MKTWHCFSIERTEIPKLDRQVKYVWSKINKNTLTFDSSPGCFEELNNATISASAILRHLPVNAPSDIYLFFYLFPCRKQLFYFLASTWVETQKAEEEKRKKDYFGTKKMHVLRCVVWFTQMCYAGVIYLFPSYFIMLSWFHFFFQHELQKANKYI